jgi:cytochrome b pre-mRNA-processing protein 6
MSSTRITKHYNRLLTLWPKDPLRPDFSFTTALQHRLSKLQPIQPKEGASKTPFTSSSPSTAKPTQPTPADLPDARTELLNINALYSLLENRYSKRYPTSPALLRPQSNPEYYERLMREIEEAPKKSWLRAKWDMWKMKVRWQ